MMTKPSPLEAEQRFDKPGNGHDPSIKVVTPAPSRVRGSWPILLLAVLFVVGAFLTWYFTWFGRELSDADIATYLVDYQHPRKVQHALLQIQQRLAKGDQRVKQWYPQLNELANNPETELRLTVAWVMGFDNKAPEFHSSLQKLLKDSEPIVRRNAALALIRFQDAAGRSELRSILQPYVVTAPANGVLNSSLQVDSQVSRGALLARLKADNNQVLEIRSPLTGKVKTLSAQSGATVTAATPILSLESDEESVYEALRGLALIGEQEDLDVINQYFQTGGTSTDRLRNQAALTTRSIQSRTKAQ